MFETLRNGFRLGSAVRKLVFKDKRLLFYPVVMGILSIIEFIIFFIGSFVLSGGLTASGQSIFPAIILGIIIFYIASAFTTTYLTMAMLLAFRSFAAKKEISMGEAFSATRPYLTLAFEWALFYSTVVLMLNFIESRFKGIANILISAVGALALTVAIMFAIPAIIDNKVGPIKAIEISAKTLVSHFGSTFGGIVYSDLYSLGLMLLGFLAVVASVFFFIISPVFTFALIFIGIIIIAFGAILGFALSNIFRFILYEYIDGKKLPEGINETLIKNSIKQKGQKTAVL